MRGAGLRMQGWWLGCGRWGCHGRACLHARGGPMRLLHASPYTKWGFSATSPCSNVLRVTHRGVYTPPYAACKTPPAPPPLPPPHTRARPHNMPRRARITPGCRGYTNQWRHYYGCYAVGSIAEAKSLLANGFLQFLVDACDAQTRWHYCPLRARRRQRLLAGSPGPPVPAVPHVGRGGAVRGRVPG